jgi:hypothetical protein
LAKALDACDVFVAVIGPRWYDLAYARAQAGDYDYVRSEIAAALQRGITIIPVRVGREGNMPRLPRPNELPEDIRGLVFHQKHDIAHERFRRDIADLVQEIESLRKAKATTLVRPNDRAKAGNVGEVILIMGAIMLIGAAAIKLIAWLIAMLAPPPTTMP